MFRIIIVSLSLLIILSLVFNAVVSGGNNNSSSCLACHEDLYSKAVSNPYMHNVIKDGCTKCHNIESINTFRITSEYYQNNIILEFNDLLDNGEKYEKENKYIVKVEATDSAGKKAKPFTIDISAQKIWNRPETSFNIKEISEMALESIKKGIYTKASISWTTNVPATSEVEYGMSPKDRNIVTSKNIFSKKHSVVLQGLRNNSEYSYIVTSRDLNGNTLQSKKQTFDTYADFDIEDYTGSKKPEIEEAMLFNIGNREDLFIRVSANTPVIFTVIMSKVQEKATRPCAGFKQTRYSTITVCLQCHPQDASHPVGVRSSNPKIIVSDQLPTIENGIITCVSCHFPHGGDRKYYLRIDFTKEICIKCHANYYNYLFR